MTVGILGAMPQEIARLESAIEAPRRVTRGMRDYMTGRIGAHDVVLVFSRWGKVAAASTVTTLIEAFGVDRILFTGVAGAIAGDLAVGDVVIASELIQHDMDVSAVVDLKLARFEIPLLHRSSFPADPALLAAALAAAESYLGGALRRDVGAGELHEFGIVRPRVRAGLIVSGDQFIADAARAAGLRSLLPAAQCVEMEGAAVAQVCYEHNVPMALVRVVSDKADHAAPVDFLRFIDRVASHFTSGIVLEMLKA
ncbi:MAG TPA: 5'-methylthioadenosine/adenosylhomocysteine nucleosidase [Stellaceae bacterium]|nr:5'-methylthioadenosine/adenosylhomocysteine nucleosidase [Stellaceae bacterium]